jgi:hypothetical protein
VNIDEAAKARREAAQRLQEKRRDLVLAAEGVIQKRFAHGRLLKPKKTQFSNLVGLCNEAQCAEEIANYLRYQAGRGEWDRTFTVEVIDGIKPVLDVLHQDSHVAAWRLYATYLTRAYVYHDSVAAAGGRSS